MPHNSPASIGEHLPRSASRRAFINRVAKERRGPPKLLTIASARLYSRPSAMRPCPTSTCCTEKWHGTSPPVHFDTCGAPPASYVATITTPAKLISTRSACLVAIEITHIQKRPSYATRFLPCCIHLVMEAVSQRAFSYSAQRAEYGVILVAAMSEFRGNPFPGARHINFVSLQTSSPTGDG